MCLSALHIGLDLKALSDACNAPISRDLERQVHRKGLGSMPHHSHLPCLFRDPIWNTTPFRKLWWCDVEKGRVGEQMVEDSQGCSSWLGSLRLMERPNYQSKWRKCAFFMFIKFCSYQQKNLRALRPSSDFTARDIIRVRGNKGESRDSSYLFLILWVARLAAMTVWG